MQVPLEITYRDIDRNDFIDGIIRKKAAKLEKACPHLVSCRVAVEQEQNKQRTGNIHRIRVDLRVPPGHELVVKRKGTVHKLTEDLPPLVREAFEAAERQVKDLVEQQQGKVKTHAEAEAADIEQG